jgi:iron complex outermembrane receptor protein
MTGDLKRAEEYGAPLGTSGPACCTTTPCATAARGAVRASGLGGERRLRLHISLSSRSRFPTIFERFSQRFGTSIPNPSLAPERARQIELGGSTKLGAVSLEGAAFHACDQCDRFESVLGYACTASTTPGPCAQTVMTQSRNVSRGEFYGIELSAQAPVLKTLSVGANYTWLHRDLVDPGNAAFAPPMCPRTRLSSMPIGQPCRACI